MQVLPHAQIQSYECGFVLLFLIALIIFLYLRNTYSCRTIFKNWFRTPRIVSPLVRYIFTNFDVVDVQVGLRADYATVKK